MHKSVTVVFKTISCELAVRLSPVVEQMTVIRAERNYYVWKELVVRVYGYFSACLSPNPVSRWQLSLITGAALLIGSCGGKISAADCRDGQ